MARMRLRPRLGLSLFWKVYLTLVAAVLLVALAIAIIVRIGEANEAGPWSERGRVFFSRTIPLDDPGPAVERLGDALGATLAVRAPDGRLVAGDPDLRRGHGVRSFTLEDGRVVHVRFGRGGDEWDDDGDRARNPLVPIAIIALLIAAVAYPVVRHLTRRLERLRTGVEAWGAGDLSARVALGGVDEVAAVARSFDEAAEAVERLLAANASLLANASHELRSPLARLRMAVDLYEESPRPALKQEIVTSLSELDGLVEEILVASRLENVGLGPFEPVDLLALVAEEGARVDALVEGEAVGVAGDATLLRRLVRNLLQNAARHGAPPIEASVARGPDGGATIRVCDGGPGLPEGETERVFEPFYRPAGRSEAAGGWGLGLSLVRQIARRHGGEARAVEVEGRGACFVVDLPGARTGEASLRGGGVGARRARQTSA